MTITSRGSGLLAIMPSLLMSLYLFANLSLPHPHTSLSLSLSFLSLSMAAAIGTPSAVHIQNPIEFIRRYSSRYEVVPSPSLAFSLSLTPSLSLSLSPLSLSLFSLSILRHGLDSQRVRNLQFDKSFWRAFWKTMRWRRRRRLWRRRTTKTRKRRKIQPS